MHSKRVGVQLSLFFQVGSGHLAGLGQTILLLQSPVVELEKHRTVVLVRDSKAATVSSLHLAVRPAHCPAVGHLVHILDLCGEYCDLFIL